MKPINELLGKTIDEVPLEELQAEFDERVRICGDITASGSKHSSAVLTRQIRSDEALSISKEIMRITFNPEAVLPPNIENMTPQEAFQAGMVYEKKLSIRLGECNRYQETKLSKYAAAVIAVRLFKDPSTKIGQAAKIIEAELIERQMKTPRNATIQREWLPEFESEGLITLPENARKGGRPIK